jgi:hypothetical protein
LWPPVDTTESAELAVRQGFWVAVICSTMTAGLVLLNLLTYSSDLRFQFGSDALFDAALFAIIAFGIWKRSRVAAVAGLTLYLVERAYMWSQFGIGNPVIALIFTCGFVNGVRGTFALARETSRATSDAASHTVQDVAGAECAAERRSSAVLTNTAEGRLARILIGYRQDLDLPSRWWHRLLKVISVIGVLTTAAVTFFVISSAYYYPRAEHVDVLMSLRDMTRTAPRDRANTISTFLGSQGELGALRNGEIVFVSEYSLAKGVCSSDLAGNAEAVAQDLNKGVGSDGLYSASGILSLIDRETNLNPASEKRYCIYDGDAVPFMSNEIVKYRWTWKASVQHYGWAALQTSIAMVIVTMIGLNLYYRGLVYIVCGPRQSS